MLNKEDNWGSGGMCVLALCYVPILSRSLSFGQISREGCSPQNKVKWRCNTKKDISLQLLSEVLCAWATLPLLCCLCCGFSASFFIIVPVMSLCSQRWKTRRALMMHYHRSGNEEHKSPWHLPPHNTSKRTAAFLKDVAFPQSDDSTRQCTCGLLPA